MKIIQLTSKECPTIRRSVCTCCGFSKNAKAYAYYDTYGNWAVFSFCTKKCLNLWILQYAV